MTRSKQFRLAGLILACAMLIGCISTRPVERQETIDDRPLLFFVVEGSRNTAESLDIYVDDLYMGDAKIFSKKSKGLVVLPGTHIIEVKSGTRVLTNQKIYVGNGVSKTITVQAD